MDERDVVVNVFSSRDVAELLTMEECIQAIREVLALPQGNVVNPLRTAMKVPLPASANGWAVLGSMPGYAKFDRPQESSYLCTKIITVYSGNKQTQFVDKEDASVRLGYHSHQGIILLMSSANGCPLAIFDASSVTAIRTAAASAVATDLLSLPESSCLGIIGSSTQAHYHVIAICLVRKIKKVLVYSRSKENCSSFLASLHAYFKGSQSQAPEFVVVENVEALCAQSHIIVTATTSSTPVLFGNMLRKGQHVNAIGNCARHSRELDDDAMMRPDAFVYSDNIEAFAKEAGDWIIPLEQRGIDPVTLSTAPAMIKSKYRGEIGGVLRKEIQGRANKDEITIFKSLGIAIEDLAATKLIYEKKTKNNSNNKGGGIPVPIGAVHVIKNNQDGGGGIIQNNTVQLKYIQAAAKRIAGIAIKTPVVAFNGSSPSSSSSSSIFLKLENLQPVTSYKVRGAANALLCHDKPINHVVTCSAGNFAQGLLFVTKRLGVKKCTVVVPDHAPQVKIDAMKRLDENVAIVKVTFAEWWRILCEGRYGDDKDCLFVSPVTNADVMAGNGTIGLEIVEQMDGDVDCVIVPYGGGALAIGIASAVKQLVPKAQVFAVEVDTAAPLHASFAAGHPVEFAYVPTFIDGMGGKTIFPENWPLVQHLLDGSLVVSVAEVAEAVRLLLKRNCVLAEGAGAAATAAAMKYQDKYKWKKVVCVVSGGNIDSEKLTKIINNEI